ncbi:MAG: alpha/beta hydrolase [Caulobacteraceae bacterium]|nr:alpha/beta hydrolase [Caulobacteraceae bacterium]
MSVERASLAQTRRYKLRCDRIGETFQIDVALPGVQPPEGRPLPVVYLLDANTVFGIAAQAMRFLQQADGAAPAILVGVGYCLDGIERPRDAYGVLRTRDFTPSTDSAFVARLLEARQGRPFAIPSPAGGADRFLDFLIDSLRPVIAERYPADLDEQILVGSSLGGLFTLYAMLSRPGAFRRYAANSPSLWWNDRELFGLEEQLSVRSPDLPADLFMSAGGLERQPPWATAVDIDAFAARLRRHDGLCLTTHVFEGESHTSVIPAALSRTLRTLLTSTARAS